MKAFDDFIKRRLIEQYRDVFSKDEDAETSDRDYLMPNSQALATWIDTIAVDRLLCQEALTQFFQNPHILGALGQSLKIVFQVL